MLASGDDGGDPTHACGEGPVGMHGGGLACPPRRELCSWPTHLPVGEGATTFRWAPCSRSSPRSLCRPTCARAPYTHARLRTYSPSQYSPRQAPVSQSGRQLHYPLQAGRDGRTDGGREPGRGRKAVRVVSTLRGCTARPDRRLRTYVLQSPVSRADRLWADRAESLAIHTSARAGGRPTS